MKKTIIGIVFILGGLLTYLIMHQNAVNYLPNMSSWDNSLGKLGQALNDTGGLIPTRISIAFMVIGLIILLIAFIDEFKLQKQKMN